MHAYIWIIGISLLASLAATYAASRFIRAGAAYDKDMGLEAEERE